MLNSTEIKTQMTNLVQWASSGTKLMYTAICLGLLVALILFKVFFKDLGGFFHNIGFSVSSRGEAQAPGQGRASRLKLFLAIILPPVCAYGAYVFLPKWFPTIFQ